MTRHDPIEEIARMTGLILTSEQVRAAPPEVRQWLKGLLEAELGAAPEAHEREAEAPALAACSPAEARQMFDRIRGDYLASQVFFELGRASAGPFVRPDHLHRIALVDIARHTRLGNLHHVAAALEMITMAFRDVRNDSDAALLAFDGRGAVYIHEVTHHSVARLWQDLVFGQGSRDAAEEARRPVAAGTMAAAAAE
jgi:hypothetical protein